LSHSALRPEATAGDRQQSECEDGAILAASIPFASSFGEIHLLAPPCAEICPQRLIHQVVVDIATEGDKLSVGCVV
jgi:hypothetical protein